MEFFPLLLGLCRDQDGHLDLFVKDCKDLTAKLRLDGALSTAGDVGVLVQCRDHTAFKGPFQLR